MKFLGTSRVGRPAGTLPQTFTCERVRVSEMDGQADRQPTRKKRETESKNRREGRGRWEGRPRKGAYPPLVELQLPSDDGVENNDDSWPVIMGCVLVTKQDANEE